MPTLLWRASDGSQQTVQVSVVSEALPPFGPSRAAEVIGVSGLTAQNDTRYIDCPGLSVPNSLQRCTIVGGISLPTQSRGHRDVWIQGRADALMNAGPRTDGNDLLQVKNYPHTTDGVIPDGLVFRWIRFHDVSRPDVQPPKHPDGVQVMAGRNGKILDCVFERCDVQPLFFRYAGSAGAGGGPIEDWDVERCYIEKPPNGFYAVRIAGNGDAYVPTRIRLKDLTLTGNVGIDRAAFDAGFTSSGLQGGTVSING